VNANTDEGGAPHTARWEIALVAAIVLLAALMCVWRIGELPPGLHVDEAFNILDARSVIAGDRPVFLQENAGREVLYTYMQAPLLAWLGESAGVARLASAIAGTLAVIMVWVFTRSLPLPRPRRVALITAAYMAFTYWHLHFSRFGIRAVLFPLLVTAAMWAWWRIVSRRGLAIEDQPSADRARWWSWWEVAALGVLLGLAFYAHPVGRALWLVPLVHAGDRWLRWRDTQPLRVLGPAFLIAGLVALPLLNFWHAHPGTFAGHASEVAVLDGGPREVAASTLAVAGMFNIAGDPAPWRNLKERPFLYRAMAKLGIDRDHPVALSLRGRPVFDPLTGLLFLAGLLTALIAAWRGADWAALCLIWFVLLLAPSVFTDAAPNYSRAIGALPVVCLFPALALDRVAAATRERIGSHWGVAVVILAIAVHAIGTSYDYFVVWAGHEDTPMAFDADKVALAAYVDRRAADGTHVYLSAATADHPTVKVSADSELRGFDPQYGDVLPMGPDAKAAYVYLESEGDARRYQERLLGLQTEQTVVDGHRLEVAESQGGAQPAPEEQSAPVFGDRIRLVSAIESGHSFAPGEQAWITLVWLALAPIEADLTTAVQIVTDDGTIVAQGDARPINGTYPTQLWRPGELITTMSMRPIADDAPEGPAGVRVGWYLPATNSSPLEPLPAQDGASVVDISPVHIGP
jgi:hypothetical protein